MKIAIFSQYYHPIQFGGAEVSTQILAEELAKMGHAVHVVTTRLANVNATELINGVSVNRFSSRNLYCWDPEKKRSAFMKLAWHSIDAWNPFSFIEIKNYLTTLRPDVVHTNTLAGLSCSVWAAADSLKIPVVHTIRDFYLLCPKSSMFKNNTNCSISCSDCYPFTLTKKLQSQSVSAVVGISNFMVQKHVSSGFFKNASQHVIPNSVASAQLQNQQPQNTSGSLRIGYLGRIHSTKGVEWLLNFIQPFLRDSVILKIAGEGEQQYFNSLQKKYSSDRVMFLGKQKSYSFLAGIDLLIVPSLWNEPLGRVVLEAYACGIPVAVSARGGLPELVIENETGCVFEPKEPHALETFIKKLQYDKSYYKKISLDVLKYADNFSKESIAKKYDIVYSNI